MNPLFVDQLIQDRQGRALSVWYVFVEGQLLHVSFANPSHPIETVDFNFVKAVA